MEGLEVIEQIAVYQVPESTIIWLVLCVFSILIPPLATYYITQNSAKTIVAEVIYGVAYAVLASALLVSGVLEKPTGEYQYKVRITEDVGYVEFTDKYEVITENDDGTYIIQEKNYIKE